MDKDPTTFETILAVFGAFSAVMVFIKGSMKLIVETIELVPKGIKAVKEAIRAWKQRRNGKCRGKDEV